MRRTRRLAVLVLAAGLAMILAAGLAAPARAQDTGAKQPYTMAEYNAYVAARDERNAALQIKLLDSFVQSFPNSALLTYIYELYYQNYFAQKNFAKAMDFVDKLLALGDKADAMMRYRGYYARALAYNSLNSNDKDVAAKARDAAIAGLKALEEIKRPDNVDEKTFEEQVRKPALITFNYTAAAAAAVAKDFPTAIKYYKATLVLTPDQAVTWFRLGVVYLSSTPPQQLNGFWALGHAVALKGPTEAQVRKYLRNQMLNYQQLGCESVVDAEMNELVALAGSSSDRPDSYKFPSSADLDAARKDMTIASVIADLKAGGEKGKVTWLAACGLEFPEVPGKLLDLAPGADTITLQVAFVTSQEEFDNAKTPDMEVKVVGQPEVARMEKDTQVRFTAFLTAFDTNPAFLLHWEKAKVNPEDIPAEKKVPAKKAPAKKAPTKKQPGKQQFIHFE
jgi:tetratricopeptide (TPR) repeat protein